MPDRRGNVATWLATLNTALDAESPLDDETVRLLVDHARPRWGVRTPDDASAYVAFWSRLVARHDDPRLQAASADVIYLLGGPSRSCEALAIVVAAIFRRPEIFIDYAGDFGDVAKQCGRSQQVDFELAKIAYYSALVDRGEMDDADLRDAVREILATHGDDEDLRNRLRLIAHSS
jgi:hypothetical protein